MCAIYTHICSHIRIFRLYKLPFCFPGTSKEWKMSGILTLYNRQQPFGGILWNNIANIIPSTSSVNTSHGIFVLCGMTSIAIILICFLKKLWLVSITLISRYIGGAPGSLDWSHWIGNDPLAPMIYTSSTSVYFNKCLQELGRVEMSRA